MAASAAQQFSTNERQEDAWKKSCVLTLDGGGIRGYASLWMLKILMDEIAQVETTHPDSHKTSAWPPNISRQNSNRTGSMEEPRHSSTDISVHSERSRRSKSKKHRRRATGETEGDGPSPDPSPSPKPSSLFLPCHYFDYIFGTSTGGLNAIMLGRLRMGIDECLHSYPELANSIFGEGRRRTLARRLATLDSTRYDSAHLETAIKDIISAGLSSKKAPRQKGFNFTQFRSPEDLCRTAVVANEENDVGSTAYVFRTYDQPGDPRKVYNPGQAHTHEIWEISRATSAAPTFFDPIIIAGKEYSDGGVGNNNPVWIAADEVMHKNETPKFVDAFSVVLSIGTGQKPTTTLKVKRKFPRVSQLRPVKRLSRMVSSLKHRAVDVEKDDKAFQKLADQVGFKSYYRWSGGEEVGGLKMDAWLTNPKPGKQNTANFIETNVRAYMARQDIKDQVEILAKELVAIRRARIRHSEEKAQRFTWCTLYHCPICADDDPGEFQETIDSLKEHIATHHPHVPPEDIDGTVKHLVPRPPLRGAVF